MSWPAKAAIAEYDPPGVQVTFSFSFRIAGRICCQNQLPFRDKRIAMPTIIPMTHHRARVALHANKSGTGQIVAVGHRAWDELQKVLASKDFRTVAIFSGIGLLVGLVAMLSGVQGVWM
jgi:hypothetical protein